MNQNRLNKKRKKPPKRKQIRLSQKVVKKA